MIDHFPEFARIVARSFQALCKDVGANPYVTERDVYVVDRALTDADPHYTAPATPGAFAVAPPAPRFIDALYAVYLNAFPEGTNPTYKARTEHDCSCCKSFIRHVGHVVGILANGERMTIWDEAAVSAPYPYNEVAKALADFVLSAPITDLFRVSKKEPKFGVEFNRVETDGGEVRRFHHFYTGPLPKHLMVDQPDTVKGDFRTTKDVFERGLTELTADAFETVVGLIDATEQPLYKGAEFRANIIAFQTDRRLYAAPATPERKSSFLWTHARLPHARLKNTAIGTLLIDLSAEDANTEAAVAAFEKKVAPENYKRTTAPISPAMIKRALDTLDALGLKDAVERRHARLTDVSVKDVLWVDSTVKPLMKGGLHDALLAHAASTATPDFDADESRAELIDIDAFVETVLPTAQSVDLLFRNEHLNNLVSLTAPVHPPRSHYDKLADALGSPADGTPHKLGYDDYVVDGDGKKSWGLFRWGNDFAFSYAGNFTDSIKERVKSAGGKIDAPLRVSLAWSNGDDLDLHVHEPSTAHIHYASEFRRDRGNRFSPNGGQLDIDMNAGGVHNPKDPVENVYWKSIVPGKYRILVNNYALRSRENVGFTIEIEVTGKIYTFTHAKMVPNQTTIPVVTMTVAKNGTVDFTAVSPDIVTSARSTEKWGLHTEQYVKVNTVMLSPNYWAGAEHGTGNKHTFFVLDGCANDEPCRGIYNEFLHPRLNEHRKVLEVVGEKTKCPVVPANEQLSGLGFSSTKPARVIVKVTSKSANAKQKQKLYAVYVGAMPTASETTKSKSKSTGARLGGLR